MVSIGLHAATATGRLDFDIGLSDQFIEPGFDRFGLIGLSESGQAFVVAMQGPDVIRVLHTSRQPVTNAEIVLVMNQGFVDMAPFQQESPECVTWRVHPGPGLRVLEVIAEHTGLAQVAISEFVIAGVILDFAIHHRLCNLEDVAAWIVRHNVPGGNLLVESVKLLLVSPTCFQIAQGPRGR